MFSIRSVYSTLRPCYCLGRRKATEIRRKRNIQNQFCAKYTQALLLQPVRSVRFWYLQKMTLWGTCDIQLTTWCVCVYASLHMGREEKPPIDATEWFIALITCSTCFGNFYAHHQEFEAICVLLPPMVCSAWLLVVGVRCRAAVYGSRKRDVVLLSSCNIPLPGRIACYSAPDPDNQQPSTAHHRR
jgi:hypothetical protein